MQGNAEAPILIAMWQGISSYPRKCGRFQFYKIQGVEYLLIQGKVVFLILCLCLFALFRRPGVGWTHKSL